MGGALGIFEYANTTDEGILGITLIEKLDTLKKHGNQAPCVCSRPTGRSRASRDGGMPSDSSAEVPRLDVRGFFNGGLPLKA